MRRIGVRGLTLTALFIAFILFGNSFIYLVLDSHIHSCKTELSEPKSAVVEIELPRPKSYDEERVTPSSGQTAFQNVDHQKFQAFDETKPKFVVLLTYHRGGSSFTGELFNTNPDAFYLYEPLDALYASMYGFDDGWTVPTDIHSFTNGSKRFIPEEEVLEVAEYLKHLFLCDIDWLPNKALIHNFWLIHAHNFIATTDFIKCIEQHNLTFPACMDINPYRCGKRLGRMVDEAKLKDCRRFLYDAPRDDPTKHGPFVKFNLCLRDIRKQVDEKCTPLLKTDCMTRPLRVFKTTRATMVSMEPLLRDIPNLRVIHAIRDPRAIARSRMVQGDTQLGLNSTVAIDEDNMMYREMMLLCRWLADDIVVRRRLERQFPGRILTIEYDNLALDMKGHAEAVYRFLNMTVAQQTFRWIVANKGKSSQTARRWISRLNAYQNYKLISECRDYCKVINNCDWSVRVDPS